MSSSVYHYAKMAPRTKSHFGVILTKETQVQRGKPRVVRLVFDQDSLNWQTGEFSLAECNGIIISRQTGFFCTTNDATRPFSVHSDSRSVHGLKNILSLYQCNRSQKLSMLHNVFHALIEVIPSRNGSLNRSMKDLCSEIKLVLKVEFKPKQHGSSHLDLLSTASEYGDASSIDTDVIHAVQLNQSHRTSNGNRIGAMFKDLPTDKASRRSRSEEMTNSRYLALKKKYDEFKTMNSKRSAVHQREMQQKDLMIQQLNEEIMSQEQSIEILRLALDSQTDIVSRKLETEKSVKYFNSSIPRPKYSMKGRYSNATYSVVKDGRIQALKVALKTSDSNSDAICVEPSRDLSLWNANQMRELRNSLELLWKEWDLKMKEKSKGVDIKLCALNHQIH